jgi:putative membrane protein
MAHSNGSHAPSTQDGATADAAPSEGTLNGLKAAKRLHPMTLLQRVLVSLPALAFILLPALTSPDTESWFSLLIGILYGIVALPAIVLQYLRFSYRITPKEIIIQSGVLTRKNRSIPIERVQNIQIEQSLIPRLTGTAKVKIETAGSAATEGVLEYVSLAEARRLRSIIRSFKAETAEDSAAADAGEDVSAEGDAVPLFSMSLGRVMLSGAFRFSLVYIAVIFSAIELLNPDPNDIARWMSRGELNGIFETAMSSPWLAGVATVIAASLFGWLTGILVNLNKYYNFRLWREGNKLRFRRGLLTLSEGTIPLKKVQALILHTNPVMRFFGWYALEVQTVGLDVEEQGHRVVMPFARKPEILPIARRIRPFDPPEEFATVSRLTIRRHAFRYTAVLVLLTGAASGLAVWTNGDLFAWQQAWWALTLTPLILAYAVLHYLNHGYAVGDDEFYVRRGVFKQYTWIIPTEKYHVFYRAASVFQRRLGLQSLFVDTAGAATFAYPEVIDLPAEDAQSTQAQLYDQFQSLYRERLQAAATARPGGQAPPPRPSIPEEELRRL